MTTALAERHALLPSATTLETMMQMAETLVASGMLPSAIKTPAAALAVMQKGSELGIPPMYALSNISVINGRPVTGAELMLALIYRDHGDHAIVFEETGAEGCTVLYKRRSWSEARRFTWGIEDARRAGLLNKEGTWRQYAPAMYRHRCISAVARMAFPDTIGGLYTHEELGAEVTVNEEGEVVPVDAPAPVVSLVEPDQEPETEAPAFDRAAAETAYEQLCAAAIALGHRQAKKLAETPVETIADDVLVASVRSLEKWLDEREAF
jgi:hypothetical protein